MKKAIIVAFAVILLSACAEVGNKQIVNDDTISRIHAGQTTKAQVKDLVGDPTKVTFTDSGDEIWDYKFESYKSNPAQFVPIVGLFASGDVDEHNLTVRFRADGVVKDVGKGHRSGKEGGGSF